jgi:hypothetical protein
VNGAEEQDIEVAAADPAVPSLRVAITAGGVPRPEEVAALTVAVASLAATASAAASVPAGTRVPAWRRAALLEQTRRPRVVRPSDLGRR